MDRNTFCLFSLRFVVDESDWAPNKAILKLPLIKLDPSQTGERRVFLSVMFVSNSSVKVCLSGKKGYKSASGFNLTICTHIQENKIKEFIFIYCYN